MQITTVSFEFNAKLSSVQERTTGTNSTLVGDVAGVLASDAMKGYRFDGAMMGSVSNQLTAEDYTQEQREFSMKIFVRASQRELPSGMAKVVSALEDSITTVV
jgi:hypothetical protein